MAVLADSPAQALNGAELVDLEMDDAASTQSLVAQQSWGLETPLTGSHSVKVTIKHPRLAPSPKEPRAISVRYEAATDSVTIWHATQTPHRTRSELSAILGINAQRIRVIARDAGGAFGMKASLYPEDVLTVWCAVTHKRNIKWTATRSDDFTSATQGRGITNQGRLSFDAAGRVHRLSAKISVPIGPWFPNSALIPDWNASRILPFGYSVPQVHVQTQAISDNRTPTGIYRGAGHPETNMLMERLIDKAALPAALTPSRSGGAISSPQCA